ncbi:hypothetical protein J7L06_09275 [Candidatus Bathyarchaeota archaeon]|nr:hypothetical protein [Candidatus Bathyarchaeota archaeon]
MQVIVIPAIVSPHGYFRIALRSGLTLKVIEEINSATVAAKHIVEMVKI